MANLSANGNPAQYNFIPEPSPEMEFYPLIQTKIEFHPFIRKERYQLTCVRECKKPLSSMPGLVWVLKCQMHLNSASAPDLVQLDFSKNLTRFIFLVTE